MDKNAFTSHRCVSSRPPLRQRRSVLGFRSLIALLPVLSVLAAVVLWSFRAANEKKPSEAGDVLLRVGDTSVRLSEVQEQIDRMPAATRSRYASPGERQAYLEKLINNEVLAAEARRLGYDRDPEVVAAMKKAMILKLLKERIGAEPAPGEISEADIEKYYRDHADEFVHPEEVRITQIVVKTRERAIQVLDEATRASADARSGAAADPATTALKAFRSLVFKYSEDEVAATRGGDLTLVAGRHDEPPSPLVEAAFALRNAGDLSPVVEAIDGFHILMLRQRVPASTRSLQESRTRLARLLSEESRDRRVSELANGLAKDMQVEVFAERFASVRFDVPE